MNYPSWAPKLLIAFYEDVLVRKSRVERGELFSLGQYIAENESDKSHASPEVAQILERIIRKDYRKFKKLSPNEQAIILERLLSDARMREVWSMLQRRDSSNNYSLDLWAWCESAIVGWRGHDKRTTAERRSLFLQIYDGALRLAELTGETAEFGDYDVKVFTSLAIRRDYAEEFGSGVDDEFIRSISQESHVHPQIELPRLLLEIATLSLMYADEKPLALKPQSKNAHIHYFVRRLSTHFSQKYGQPLHDAVAIVASVVLDENGIDGDYVRKLVREQPG